MQKAKLPPKDWFRGKKVYKQTVANGKPGLKIKLDPIVLIALLIGVTTLFAFTLDICCW